jgi:hypothetical protein
MSHHLVVLVGFIILEVDTVCVIPNTNRNTELFILLVRRLLEIEFDSSQVDFTIEIGIIANELPTLFSVR